MEKDDNESYDKKQWKLRKNIPTGKNKQQCFISEIKRKLLLNILDYFSCILFFKSIVITLYLLELRDISKTGSKTVNFWMHICYFVLVTCILCRINKNWKVDYLTASQLTAGFFILLRLHLLDVIFLQSATYIREQPLSRLTMNEDILLTLPEQRKQLQESQLLSATVVYRDKTMKMTGNETGLRKCWIQNSSVKDIYRKVIKSGPFAIFYLNNTNLWIYTCPKYWIYVPMCILYIYLATFSELRILLKDIQAEQHKSMNLLRPQIVNICTYV